MGGRSTTRSHLARSAPQPSGAPPIRARRVLRKTALGLVWTVVSLVLLVLATLDILQRPGGQEWLRRQVLQRTRAILPGLQVQRIAGDFTRTLELAGVVLDDRFGGPAIRVRRISLRYDLIGLARGELRIGYLVLDHPELQIRPSENGELNLTQLVVLPPTAPEPPTKPTTMRIDLRRLQIRQGTVSVTSPGASAPLVLQGIDLNLGLRGGLGDATAQLRTVGARIRLPDGKRLQAQLQGRVALDATRIDAQIAGAVHGLTPTGALTIDLKARGPHRRVALDTRLETGEHGVLHLGGWAGLGVDQHVHYALNAKLTGVDLPWLIPAVQASPLDLRLGLAGDGVPLQPGSRATVALDVRPMTIQGLRVDGVTLRAATADGRWELKRLQVKGAGGQVRLSGTGTLQRVDATVHVDLPRLDRLGARVHQLGVPALGGSVKLSAHVAGPMKGPFALESDLLLQHIAVARLRLRRAHLAANLAGLPGAPRGTLKLLAQGLDPGDARLRVDRATLELTGNPRRLHLRTDVQGALKARIDADADIAPDGRRVAVRLHRLELHGMGHDLTLRNQPTLVYHHGVRIELDPARLSVLEGEVVASGVFRPHGFPRLVVALKANGVRPPGLGCGVRGAVQVRANRREVDASVEAELTTGSRLELSTQLPVRYHGTMPAVDARREGALKLRISRLDLGLLNTLRPGLPRTTGSVDLTLDATGKIDDPRLQLMLALREAGWGEIHGVGGTTRIAVADGRTAVHHRVTLGGRPLLTLDGAVPLSLAPVLQGINAGGFRLDSYRELPVELRLDLHPTRLSELPPLHPMLERMGGRATVHLELKGPLMHPVLQARTRLEGGVVDEVQLGDIEVRTQVTAEANRLSGTLAVDRDRQALLRAQGRADVQLESLLRRPRQPIPLDLQLEVPLYELSRLTSLDARLKDLSGTLQGKVHLWDAGAGLQARAEIGLKRVAYAKVKVGDVALTAAFDGKQIDATFGVRQTGGGGVKGEARLSLVGGGIARAQDEIVGRVQGQRMDLAFLHRLAPHELRQSGGKLGVDLRVTGRLTRPVVAGHMTLDDGKLALRGVSMLHHIRARVELEPERIRLVHLGLQADRGRLDLSGTVDLAGKGLELSRGTEMVRSLSLLARARGLGLDAGAMMGVVFSGDVKLKGEHRNRLLALQVSVEDGVVKVPKIEGQRQTLSTELPGDVVFVEPGSPRAAAVAGKVPRLPLALRIDLAADPLFVRGEDLDLEVANDLHIRTDEKGRPRITGKVEIRRGRIRALNNTFEVRHATVSFSGEVEPDPALNILLERSAPETLVLVQVTGTASAPELTLRSDPPIYDQSQIISLLLTGRVDARPNSSGGGDQTSAIASAVAQVLLGGVLRRVAPRVGIDVVRVGFDRDKDQKTGESQVRAEAEVGKYITERLYVAYRGVVGASVLENSNEGLMEYRISARWLLMALFGDAGVGGLDLIWNLRY